jgi:hypothetical protein
MQAIRSSFARPAFLRPTLIALIAAEGGTSVPSGNTAPGKENDE